MRTVLLALLLFFLPLSASAAVYTVNTFHVDAPSSNPGLAGCDSNPGLAGDQCTLRAAIMKANEGPSLDTIVLPLGETVTLTIPDGGVGSGAESGDLDITSPVIITGIILGPPDDVQQLPVIQADTANRIMHVLSGGNLELYGVQIRSGVAFGGGGIQIDFGGSALIDRVRFSQNQATLGGAVRNFGDSEIVRSDFLLNRSLIFGSAILNLGELNLRDSSIRISRNEGGTGETIHVSQGSITRLENVYIDAAQGDAGEPQSSGISGDRPELLSLRNTTITGAIDYALNIFQTDQFSNIDIYNSILANSGTSDCGIESVPGDLPTVNIAYNVIESGTTCSDFYGPQDNITELEDPLLEFENSEPGSVVVDASPQFNSPATDGGFPQNVIPANPDMVCLSGDIRATPRPLDGDANGSVRCDLGATERSTTTTSTYTVNVFNVDAVDAIPGDDVCDYDLVTAGPQCTLRAAVMEANDKVGPDRIEFVNNGDDNTIILTMGGAGADQIGDLEIYEAVVIDGIAIAGRPVTTIISLMGERHFDLFLPARQQVLFHQLRLQGGQTDSFGGAIRASFAGEVYVSQSELSGNSADGTGGALANNGADLYVYDSDLHNNTAMDGGAAIDARSYFIMRRSSVWNNTSLSVTELEAVRKTGNQYFFASNSTISGNTGGLGMFGSGGVELRNLTIVDNDQFGLRAVESDGLMSLALRGSIVAGNGLADCSVISGGGGNTDNFNLIEDGSCSPGSDNLSGNPMLAPELARIDQRVSRVHRPLLGSPVLDAVPADVMVNCPEVDQNSMVRPTDSDNSGMAACEMGAVEMTQAQVFSTRDIVVNTYDIDLDDLVPGDSFCDASPLSGLQCTLRAAIMETNALSGFNTIGFAATAPTISLTQPNAGGINDASHGDLDILDALVINGSQSSPDARPLLQASSGERIFNINAPGDSVAMFGLRLTGGATSGSGGAVRVINAENVTISRTRMFSNTADLGGGALSVTGGTVFVDESDFFNNATAGDGAAIRNSGDLTLSRSSVQENLDLQPVGQREAISVIAGGITEVVNSTISGNNGDGVDVENGTLALRNSTVVENDRWGIEFDRVDGETLFIANSILSDNSMGGCVTFGAGAAVISTDNHNLAQNNGCELELGGSNIVGAASELSALTMAQADFTAYHTPQVGSPALDNGHPLVGGIGCSTVDQLNTARATDGDNNGINRCDIGSIEAVIDFGAIFADSLE